MVSLLTKSTSILFWNTCKMDLWCRSTKKENWDKAKFLTTSDKFAWVWSTCIPKISYTEI